MTSARTTAGELEALAETARRIAGEGSPLRPAAGAARSPGRIDLDRKLWRRMAELGWTGILLDESRCGSGLGLAELDAVLCQLGRALTPSAFLSSVLLGSELLSRAGDAGLAERCLPGVIAGERILALAFAEGHAHAPELCRTTAARVAGGGWSITGQKRMVLDGTEADTLIVIARTAGGDDDHAGRTAFMVDPKSAGVQVSPRLLLNHRVAADVALDGVLVEDGQRIGDVGQVGACLDLVLDRATIGLCSEMLGSTLAAFEMTLDYLKTRRQFGVPIGSFQALQHRMAVWWSDIELAGALLQAAIAAADSGSAEVARMASAAKACLSELYLRSGAEAIQLHGGMGMTAEAKVGIFVKQARIAASVLGDAAYHKRRFSALGGYG